MPAPPPRRTAERRRVARPAVPPSGQPPEPIRGELLTIDQLLEHAAAMAAAQDFRTESPPRITPLLPLVQKAEKELTLFRDAMTTAVREGLAIPPATEWLLDNFYLIQEQTIRVKEDLPQGYGLELPFLARGESEGWPRIYEAMVDLVKYTDARLDREYLHRFVNAFQEGSPLTIGEIWALPIMLRVVLVENLRRLSVLVYSAFEDDQHADHWADWVLAATDSSAAQLERMVRELEGACEGAGPGFFLRLHRRLRHREDVPAPILDWLDDRVERLGATLESLSTEDLHRQAANQVSAANSITSIRLLNALDWRSFFEDVSVVEHILREDPVGVYPRMTFLSRDRYRDAVEGLSRRCPASESEVARAVVAQGRSALAANPADQAVGHIGYYLVGEGRYAFENALRYKPRPRERAYRGPLRRRGAVFFGLLWLILLALEGAIAAWGWLSDVGPIRIAALCVLALVPLSDVALTLTNRLAVMLWPARMLPSLDFREPLLAAHRTLVVVPKLCTSVESAREAVERLEVHYLTGDQDPNVHFALACELRGAPKETMPGDADILELAQREIERLNSAYGTAGAGPFHLFIRKRQYNESEGEWLCWERKRGALAEINRFLRGAEDTSIVIHEGDRGFLRGVIFVLTLDADTVLPRDGVRRLTSIIAHPLNRARLNTETRRVTRGYGIVQPRVSMALPSSEQTYFSWMHTGSLGIDPYGGVVSDAYQDVFGEGSFTGKAIYEVDVFEETLRDRIPENRILSHDLLEGNYARVGLASNVEVFDDYPAAYVTHTIRKHRWTRGDWQTIPWLMPWVPTESGGLERTVLSPLHRWKLFDNLRRSLVSPTLLAMIVAGWWLVPEATFGWVTIVTALVFFPAAMQLFDGVTGIPEKASTSRALRTIEGEFRRDAARALFSLSTLPYDTWITLDAIVKALWRSTISGKRMLEWIPAAEAERLVGADFRAHLRRMWPSVALGILALAPAIRASHAQWYAAIPLLVLWVASPYSATVASRPMRAPAKPLASSYVRLLRRAARRTWRFFDVFVTAEDNWLAPDNFQEDPKGEVAHRTSPTNIGLQLLSYLSAYDFGYISTRGLVDRVSACMGTLAGLERFRGHFYNWYDTRTLEPLPPGYISTVDSGNLAGHLLVLRVGLLESSEAPLIGPQVVEGLRDTVRVAIEDVGPASIAPLELRPVLRDLETLAEFLALSLPPATVAGWRGFFRDLDSASAPIAKRLQGLPPDDGYFGSNRAVHDVVQESRRLIDDFALHLPFAELLASVPAALHDSSRRSDLSPLLDGVPSLVGLAEGLEIVLEALDDLAASDDASVSDWAASAAIGVRGARPEAVKLLARLRLMADIAREMWEHADFKMLYEPNRKLFSIGFNTAEGRLDPSYYDLLASECRLASFLAVAKGDVPASHWFRLGRAVTTTSEGFALVSWSASMFEYLMPTLVMRTWENTLLAESCHTVVQRQIEYGKQRGVPWGISESAFNAKDGELNYQYQAFGVPGLGLKRGLSEEVVIAPYATMLTLPFDQRAAVENLRALADRGAAGPFGYYEAVDYTPGRIPGGAERAIVKAYMAHHQGMSLVALGNFMTDDAMPRRFHEDPLVRSAEVLLQERTPRHVTIEHPHREEVRYVSSVRALPQPRARSYPTADTPVPATHFLSNARYSVMVTNAGGGYSRWQGMDVSRYREDVTRDCWGTFVYLRDVASGDIWSAAYQPTLARPDLYNVTFSPDKAEFRRHDGRIETRTEIFVSPEDDVETRRVLISNHGREERRIEVTSYFEASLAPAASDQAHRTFSNLFVETDWEGDPGAILFTRRPRHSGEDRVWGFHVLACDTQDECEVTCETDRATFLGRLRQPREAIAVEKGGDLSGRVGVVLDPVCALRRTVVIGPGETARLAFSTGVATTKDGALALASRYADIRAAQRALDLSWTSNQIVLRDLGLSPEDAVVFQRLASRLLLTDPCSKLKMQTSQENKLPLSGLWPLGVSGDLPIMLLRIERLEDTPLVRQLLLAHQYWRYKGLISDLVILNTRPSAYSDELHDRLSLLVRTGHALELLDKPGGIFLRRADQMNPDVRNLLESTARAVIDGDQGSLLFQLNQRASRPELPLPLVRHRQPREDAPPAFERPVLESDNGYGGFDADAREYVIVAEGDTVPPAPWVNVMANEGGFGSMVTEAGIGCTWDINSHENRLTTWNNDPVSDGSGECVYLRDEDTGEVWSPTPLPVPAPGPVVIRHGRGYSTFRRWAKGIESELSHFVLPDKPVRIVQLTLTNRGDDSRSISVTQLVEWCLGESRSKAQQRVVTWFDAEREFLTAHNHFNLDFPGRTAFLASDRPLASYTASRTEFLGRNGHPADPAALHRVGLGRQTGRFHDMAGVLMCKLDLEPGQCDSVAFMLGEVNTLDEARQIVSDLRVEGAVDQALASTKDWWSRLLDTVTISTPDRDLDLLVNGFLLHQALACRIWGRTALYQSSGAYGFRDQLQDSLALLFSRPDIVRQRIMEAASHQFPEGDVLHWWMPVSRRGVRTRITDDRHWLPYVVAEYLDWTGDDSILDERIAYISAPPLEDGQHDAYIQPSLAESAGSIYEHCLAALATGKPKGPHGLPLMGGGDWNDGMDRVGAGGKGESVWLAWFLDVTARKFARVCEMKGDGAKARELTEWADEIIAAIESAGWDGEWYRRAYFDDGTPLGTSSAEECRIDAIAQAWATISGQGREDRAARALAAVDTHLVREDIGIIQLLDPPFDEMRHDPGYIKGYVPGVRENGGQYTHGALWVVLAHLLRGDGERGAELLRMINPIRHSAEKESADTYAVEPYVVAADVYAAKPHEGRGGWTWYTGSAGWFYRVVIVHLLGIRTAVVDGSMRLLVNPTIPPDWEGFSATVRLGDLEVRISVDNTAGFGSGVLSLEVDGTSTAPEAGIPLDGEGVREARVVLGA